MQIWNLKQKFIRFHILQCADGHINIFKCIEVLCVGDVFQNFPKFGLWKNAVLTVDKHRDLVPFYDLLSALESWLMKITVCS